MHGVPRDASGPVFLGSQEVLRCSGAPNLASKRLDSLDKCLVPALQHQFRAERVPRTPKTLTQRERGASEWRCGEGRRSAPHLARV